MIALIEQLHAAAAPGNIRAILIVTVNPLLEVETAIAGDLDNVKKHLLMGGLVAATQKLQQIK